MKSLPAHSLLTLIVIGLTIDGISKFPTGV